MQLLGSDITSIVCDFSQVSQNVCFPVVAQRRSTSSYLLQKHIRGTNDALKVAFGSLLDGSEDLIKRRFSSAHWIIFRLSTITLKTYLELTTAETDSRSLGRTPLLWASIGDDPAATHTLIEHPCRGSRREAKLRSMWSLPTES